VTVVREVGCCDYGQELWLWSDVVVRASCGCRYGDRNRSRGLGERSCDCVSENG
jgi:hypothetical protein